MCYILFMYNRILCCHNLNFSKHYSLIHSSKGSVQNHWFIQERRVTSQWSVYSIDSFKTLIHSGKTSYESVIRLLNRFVQNTDSFRKDELRVSDPFTQSIRSKHWFIQERRVTSQWSVYSIDSFKTLIHSGRRVTSQWSVYSIDSFKTLIHSGKTSYESVIRLLNRFVQNHWFIQERRVTSQWSVYSIDSFKTLIHSGKTSYESVIRLLNRFVQNLDSRFPHRQTTSGESRPVHLQLHHPEHRSPTGLCPEPPATLSIHPRLRVLTQLHLYCQICGWYCGSGPH